MKEYQVKVLPNGTKMWMLNGQLHREDGPAIESLDGDKFWFLNNQLHREGGPACEYSHGEKNWYLNNKLHREDGPAKELPNGVNFWYLNGEQLTEKEFRSRKSTIELTLDQIAEKFNIMVEKLKIVKL